MITTLVVNKRKEAEDSVESFVNKWQYPFGIAMRDIQEATNLPLGTVFSVVVSLAEKGRIFYTPGISRSIGAI